MIERPTRIDEGGRSSTIFQPGMLQKESKTIAVREHTVRSGKVSVLDTPPTTPTRKWSGVAHDRGDILYLRADSLAAIHEWLISKQLGSFVDQEDGSKTFVPEGCYVDTIGDIMLEPQEVSIQNDGKLTITRVAVMAGGYHTNVRLL